MVYLENKMLLLKFTNVGTIKVSEIPVPSKELLNDALLNISDNIDTICLCLKESDTYDNAFSEIVYTYSYDNACFVVKQANDLPKDKKKITISPEANKYINSILK